MLGRISPMDGASDLSAPRADLLVFLFPACPLCGQIILNLIQNQFYSIVFNDTSEISGGRRDEERKSRLNFVVPLREQQQQQHKRQPVLSLNHPKKPGESEKSHRVSITPERGAKYQRRLRLCKRMFWKIYDLAKMTPFLLPVGKKSMTWRLETPFFSVWTPA